MTNSNTRTCRCGVVFTPARPHQLYCTNTCTRDAEVERQRVRRQAKPKKSFPPRLCVKCGGSFVPVRKNQSKCGPICNGKMSSARPANLGDSAISADAVRLFADNFYLADLPGEIERIGKTRGIVAALETALVEAIVDDAVWPVGKPGRIALALALLKSPTLTRHRWRHPHEKRRRPGEPRKPTGTAIRAHGIPGARV